MMGSLFLSVAFAEFAAQQIAQHFAAIKDTNLINTLTDHHASLKVFEGIFQFLNYFPVISGILALISSVFLRDVFKRHR